MANASSSSSSPCDLHVDDSYYFLVLSDSNEEIFPISDEKYAEELQLQEALMSSVLATRLSFEALDDEVVATQLSFKLSENDMSKKQRIQQVTDGSVGESSSNTKWFCEICMEGKLKEEMFEKNKCSHFFCSDCISKHIATKIHENINTIQCPELNCKIVFEPENCRSFIPDEVFDRWTNALCESYFILESQKFYCPFKDCSALLVDDGGEVVRESECPICRRLFCAQCMIPWHSDISCEDYQNLDVNERGRDDRMVIELAKKKNWRRCPSCKFLVEKTDGCLHINCRCGFQFCYGCGGLGPALMVAAKEIN
ncbi:hypothetical protein IFM89_028616 [Coptis chinensis]|uniref:RBR-type E3 ubiquitin transferase n=1 Tax=Coptis chinensis TaxID=261450 RepID=A0A835M229_9MAGN|nr:hypothetical protein IFM89_028616 [Coptis chinensis]